MDETIIIIIIIAFSTFHNSSQMCLEPVLET